MTLSEVNIARAIAENKGMVVHRWSHQGKAVRGCFVVGIIRTLVGEPLCFLTDRVKLVRLEIARQALKHDTNLVVNLCPKTTADISFAPVVIIHNQTAELLLKILPSSRFAPVAHRVASGGALHSIGIDIVARHLSLCH